MNSASAVRSAIRPALTIGAGNSSNNNLSIVPVEEEEQQQLQAGNDEDQYQHFGSLVSNQQASERTSSSPSSSSFQLSRGVDSLIGDNSRSSSILRSLPSISRTIFSSTNSDQFVDLGNGDEEEFSFSSDGASFSSLSEISSDESSSENESVGFHPKVCIQVGKSLLDEDVASKAESTITKRMNARRSLNMLEEYVCSICTETIVGAVVLDCASGGHSFCGKCIQEYMNHVRSKSTKLKCPNCGDLCSRAVPCRTLDIAILDTIQKASDLGTISEDDLRSFYTRLIIWQESLKGKKKIKQEGPWHRRSNGLAAQLREYFGNIQIGAWASGAAAFALVVAVSMVRKT